MSTRPRKPPDRALVESLAQCAFVIMATLTRVGAEYDLSLTQLRVLGILRDRRPRMAELAAFLGLDRSTLSGLIDRAETRGLVRREPSADDGRAFDVFMTAAGKKLAEQVLDHVSRELAPMIDRLDDEGQRALGRLLGPMLTDAPAGASAGRRAR